MTARCFYCGEPVNPGSRTTWRRVVGWERMAGIRASGKHGGSDIALRERRDEFACPVCIRKQQIGVAPTQGALL